MDDVEAWETGEGAKSKKRVWRKIKN